MSFITSSSSPSNEEIAFESKLDVDISDPFPGVMDGNHRFEKIDLFVLPLPVARLSKRDIVIGEGKMHRGFGEAIFRKAVELRYA